MVSGFNHIDLGTITVGVAELNKELSDKIKKFAENGKPLICSGYMESLGASITVPMCYFGGAYLFSADPLFTWNIHPKEDSEYFVSIFSFTNDEV